jgi:hypothetical protein
VVDFHIGGIEFFDFISSRELLSVSQRMWLTSWGVGFEVFTVAKIQLEVF